MRTLSCARARLYARGGLHEDAPDAAPDDEAGLGRWIANLYEPYSYARPLPAHILSKNPETASTLVEYYHAMDANFGTGAASGVFELDNAILYDRALSVVVPPGELVGVYETNRAVDRPWKGELDPALLQHARRPNRRDVDYIYFGSVGSENYAHWLVDDLTRAKALGNHLGRERAAVIVLDAYFPQIDAVRSDSLKAVIGESADVAISFIDKKVPHFFDRLYYVSPSSYPPLLKAPAGIQFLYDRLKGLRGDSPSAAPKRLFIGRNALWRNLINAEEVADFFTECSFSAVAMGFDSLTFAQQVQLFSNAEIVVGVAGAAMVNTMFCRPSTRVFYLAGEGFVDPWYWDLAAVKGHEYSVCFGTPWKPTSPNFSSFVVDTEQLKIVRTWFDS